METKPKMSLGLLDLGIWAIHVNSCDLLYIFIVIVSGCPNACSSSQPADTF